MRSISHQTNPSKYGISANIITKYLRKLINSLFGLIGLKISALQTPGNNLLWKYGIPKNAWYYKDNHFYIPEIDLKFKNEELIENISFNYAKRLFDLCNGRFKFNAENKLIIQLQDVNFVLNDSEELSIIDEVFIEQFYNFTTKHNVVVIDIGQNVAISSIYFALKPNVLKVYGFEIFPVTFELAQINLTNNPVLSQKIISKPFGLGKEDKELTLQYSARSKGRMSMYGLPADVHENVVTADVIIKDVFNEISAISKSEAGIPLVCKMDCEGAEYEILERLFNQNAIGLIDIYMIEWHERNPDYLVELFKQNGFRTLKITFEETTSGMLYCFK
jgi:FkbM family methyltransferase